MSENIRVAIDGPSGAGKSTLARSVAARLNFLYVDTGAIYRTIGYAVWRKGIDPRDRSAVVAVLLDTTALDFFQSEDALLHIIRERTGL